MNKISKFTVMALTGLGFMLLGPSAFAQTAPPAPNYTGAITNAVDQGTGVLSSNVLLLLALPALWVGYRVARKVIGKIG